MRIRWPLMWKATQEAAAKSDLETIDALRNVLRRMTAENEALSAEKDAHLADVGRLNARIDRIRQAFDMTAYLEQKDA